MKNPNILAVSIFFLFSQVSMAQADFYRGEFSLGDVQLLDGPFKKARDLNIKNLLEYDVDRLLAPYLKEAGLQPKDSSYQNWSGLDGHVGGHYLSALAMNYAATGNAECKRRLDYMISELRRCQDANAINHLHWGKGYVGGVPNSDRVWLNLKNGDLEPYRAAWVPWYNVHKLFAGLRDAWLYARSEEAKLIFLRFCDWAIDITGGLTETQMQSMLDTEHGGMNEVLADAYELTRDKNYKDAALRFSHRQLLEPMSQGHDNLDNKHANTQVPKAVGFQRIGELTGETKYSKAGSFFWRTVTTNRTLAFGGNSRREFFPSVRSCTDFIDDVEGPESCNSYNMLKLTQGLFRANPLGRYMDYYERTLYNHILSTQHPETGGYVYFTPARPRSYRVFSAPNEAMWCCVGSGMENHGKYNAMIYTHRDDSLFLNLFIPSELHWKNKGLTMVQETKFPYEARTTLKIKEGNERFALMIRYPSWVYKGELKIWLNGNATPVKLHPSSYAIVDREWKKGDVVEVELPMHTSIEQLPNVPAYIALLHGPILLGAKTGVEDLKGLIADDSRWGHIPPGKRLPLDQAPIIIEDKLPDIARRLNPVANKPLYFSMAGIKLINQKDLVLQPFYEIHDARYMIYWMALSGRGYRAYLDSIAGTEQQKLSIQQRTIDFVVTGEQQPEADHALEKSNSRTGHHLDQSWRDAHDDGYFSYKLATNREAGLSLIVRYWGAEWGERKFDIFIDDQKLVSENNTQRWNQSRFHDIEYNLPDSLVKGKDQVRVKFKAKAGSTAGAVYYIRLVRKADTGKISSK